jgi:hypothetical protein
MVAWKDAVDLVFAEMQGLFLAAPNPPQVWKKTVGQEMAANLDIYTDECCQGLAFLIVTSGALEIGTTQHPGGPRYTRLQFGIGVMRCAPTIGDDLRSPSAAEEGAYTNQVLDDGELLLETVRRASTLPWITEGDISPEPQWNAIPVEGGCGGGMVIFEMAVISDCPVI